MARVDILDMLYTKDMNPMEFSFESLTARPLLSFITPYDIQRLNKIALSVKLSSKIKQKYKLIDEILTPLGFKKLASGTNRVVYKHLEDQNIIIKVALDRVALNDTPREYHNQFLLKPFVTKVFEHSPCGTVGLFERVNPVQTREEYSYIASDVFDVINTKIIGQYVMDDIGTKFFQNVGVREGFGVVYLDFPYVYELDGNKLFCNKPVGNGHVCGGEIDYDAGYNTLICTKCGKKYFAHQLQKMEKEKQIIVKKERRQPMLFEIVRGDEVLRTIGSNAKESEVLPKKKEEKIGIVSDEITEKSDRNENNSSSDYANGLNQMYAVKEESKDDQEDDIKVIDHLKITPREPEKHNDVEGGLYNAY